MSYDTSAGYEWKPYHYDLNFGVNLEFCVLFGVSTIYQAVLMIKLARAGRNISKHNRRRYVNILIPFLVGFILEVIGYIGRLISRNDKMALGPFIMQSITILIAPAFMAATLYMAFGEIVKAFDGHAYSIIPIKWVTKIFVTGDVLSILLQAAGGGVQGIGTLNSLDIGNKMIIAGLWVQIFFYATFIVTSGIFFFRFYSKPKASWATQAWFNRRSWTFMLIGVYITALFIFVRSIYRVIEYLQGQDGELLSNEVYLFVLDSSMVFFAGCVFLGIDISSNLAKVIFQKENREEYNLETQPLK